MTEHVKYFNTSISNPSTATSPIPAQFSQKFNSPLIDDVQGKQLSIIRFSLPVSGSPYFLYQNNSFNITLSYNGFDYKSSLNVQTLDGSAGIVFLGQLLTALNSAISTAFSSLTAANTTQAQFQNAPFVTFNPQTQLFSITYDGVAWQNTPSYNSSTSALLYFCSPLYQLFNNMESKQIAINSASGKDQLMIVENRRTNIVLPTPTFFTTLTSATTSGSSVTSLSVVSTPSSLPANAYLAVANGNLNQQVNYVQLASSAGSGATTLSTASFTSLFAYPIGSPVYVVPTSQITMSDESSSAVDWLSLSSIQITSSLLPIQPEAMGASYLAASNPAILSGSMLLTDYLIPVQDRLTSNTEVTYIGYAPYRRLDMVGKGELLQFDYSIYTKDRFGNVSLLQVPPGGNVDVKFGIFWVDSEPEQHERAAKRRKISS